MKNQKGSIVVVGPLILAGYLTAAVLGLKFAEQKAGNSQEYGMSAAQYAAHPQFAWTRGR